MEFDTPILFIIFNRPEHTRQVFKAIKKIAPRRLYISADGPRENIQTDIEKTRRTREIVNEINWPCEVQTLFRAKNAGCGKAVSEAIFWFFEKEEKGIILEDDCIPETSFFFFCQELLEKYKHDSRVMHIAGSNHFPSVKNNSRYSYHFAQVGQMWGWATWRRAWNAYDKPMTNLEEVLENKYFKQLYPNFFIRRYFRKKFLDTYNGEIDTWDYQWEFTRLVNSGLSIVPKNNLVRNIGFGEEATHTVSEINYFSFLETKGIDFPLNHPPFMIKDNQSERLYFIRLFKWLMKRKLLATIGIKGYSSKG